MARAQLSGSYTVGPATNSRGGIFSLLCPSGQVVVGFESDDNVNQGTRYIRNIAPLCQALSSGVTLTGSAAVGTWASVTSYGYYPITCPAGQVVVGFDVNTTNDFGEVENIAPFCQIVSGAHLEGGTALSPWSQTVSAPMTPIQCPNPSDTQVAVGFETNINSRGSRNMEHFAELCQNIRFDTVAAVAPSLPTDLSASCPSPGTTASLHWDAVSGATYYDWRASDTKNGWTANADCTGLQPGDQCVNNYKYADTAFTSIPGDTYNWWVHACNAAGCSAAAIGAPFTCALPPAPSLTCSPATQTVNVSQATTVTASGGTGSYSWFTDSTGTLSAGAGSAMNVIYTAAGTHVLTVTSGNQSTSCNIVANNPALTASISANPTSIISGQSSILTWSSTGDKSCTINNGLGSVAFSGSSSVSPTVTTTYTLNCASDSGAEAIASATVTVGSSPPSGAPILSAATSCSPTSVKLSWTFVSGADYYYIRRCPGSTYGFDSSTSSNMYSATCAAWSGNASGTSVTDTTTQNNTTYTYGMVAHFPSTGYSSTWSNLSTVTPFCAVVGGGPFTLSLGGPVFCNSVPLSWTSSSNAFEYTIKRSGVFITPYQPYTALNFTDTSVSENVNYVYQILAYASDVVFSNTLSVTTPYCPPTLNFSANPTSINQGQSTTLTWSTTHATSCTASGGWSGSKLVNGSEVKYPSPPPSVTYTLVCTGLGGTVSQSATINISTFLPTWKEIIPR